VTVKRGLGWRHPLDNWTKVAPCARRLDRWEPDAENDDPASFAASMHRIRAQDMEQRARRGRFRNLYAFLRN